MQKVLYQSGVKLKVPKRDYLWVGMLLLYGMNFMNIGWYIPLLLSPVIIVYLLKGKFSYEFISPLVSLLAFNLVYMLFLFIYDYSSISSILGKFLYPLWFFVLGDMLVRNDYEYKKTYRYIMILVVSNTLFGLLCVIKTVSVFGSMDAAITLIGRITLNIWDGKIIASTILNMSLSFGLALSALMFISSKKEANGKTVKFISFLCFIISTYCVIQLGNRTGLIIAVVSFATVVLLSENKVHKRIFAVFFASLLTLALMFLYHMNFLGIASAWQDTVLYERFNSSLSDDPRVDTWIAAFWGIFEHPLGGKETIMPLSFAHNLWLDVGYEAGVFPFLALIIFTAFSLRSLVRFTKSKYPVMLKSIVIGLYTSFFITFFAEPILQGGVAFFTMFCFIFGMIQRLNFDQSVAHG